MEKPDTRRKIMFYLNPESSMADRYVCDEIDRMPQGDRGKTWRAALLAGFALRKQDSRLPHMLAELLTDHTTFEEMVLVMQAVFPEEMKTFGARRPGPVTKAPTMPEGQRTESEVEAKLRDETQENAKAMFNYKAD
ncbi:plasmid partitioning/stability family protein [Dickeya oryzae]|uniref:Plasmid partitioning/stability family protein n=1 Tax=Dickeya oryzae TaxID=1240404 RepID=A0AB39IR89_9GAMM|nr:plasmid partitioning/stability family protein [Dickeya oryzae]MCA6990788.1 plasmid partitioning/stability family protein [Dickeya oryzae]